MEEEMEGDGAMDDVRDPAIKLFGRTILSHPSKDTDDDASVGEVGSRKIHFAEKVGDPDGFSNSISSNEDEESGLATAGQEEVQSTTDASSQEKTEKKPDKIIPCPRCNSLNTKFCYYNNYNVNQPRHFCKNCQRYWTAGGNMRNVPVGSGRRKNKHSNSPYHHMLMSSNEMPNGINLSSEVSHQQVRPSGGLSACVGKLNDNTKVLKFGPDISICESMATALNLGEHNGTVDNSFSTICGESGEEFLSRSSIPSAASADFELPKNEVQIESEPGPGIPNDKTPEPPAPFYAAPPWPFPWGPVWNGVAAMAAVSYSSDASCSRSANSSHPLPWAVPQMMAPSPFYGPSIPYPLVPPPSTFWAGCMPGWNGNPWTVPWFPSGNGVSPSSSGNSGCSSGGSPILGKHSRDGDLPTEEKLEKCLWIPKTLRIDDPDEAAKSSIWATLGIKTDGNEPVIKGGMFKAFRQDVEGQECASDTSSLLQANPAALSRSRKFQENSK